ncbi:MAG TPA: hypothetical protein VHY91_05465 [Pirellulales bacterium]|nr:hypothetical protein [Pirellulales bacterium]
MNALDILHEMRIRLEATENPTPKQLAELLALNTKQLIHLSEVLEGVPMMRSAPPKHRE